MLSIFKKNLSFGWKKNPFKISFWNFLSVRSMNGELLSSTLHLLPLIALFSPAWIRRIWIHKVPEYWSNLDPKPQHCPQGILREWPTNAFFSYILLQKRILNSVWLWATGTDIDISMAVPVPTCYKQRNFCRTLKEKGWYPGPEQNWSGTILNRKKCEIIKKTRNLSWKTLFLCKSFLAYSHSSFIFYVTTGILRFWKRISSLETNRLLKQRSKVKKHGISLNDPRYK